MAVPGEAVDAIFLRWITGHEPLAVALEGRWSLDCLTANQATSLRLESHGELRKLQLLAIGTRAGWKQVEVGLDQALLAQPMRVVAAPEDRPVSDPRPFAALKGKVDVVLRTGEVITAPILAAGPFNLALGKAGAEVLVPLHAIARWAAR